MPANPGGLTLHPLIRGLAVGVDNPNNPNFAGALQAAVELPPPPPGPLAAPLITTINNAVAQFSDPQRADVVMFAGYLGPTEPDPLDGNKHWRLLYQDAKAMTWLLVPENAIVLHDRAPDKRAAFQLRDVIWVLADAPVRQGSDSESAQARFLAGTFTTAGDLHASLTDATSLSPGSGILCAPTPECCPRWTR